MNVWTKCRLNSDIVKKKKKKIAIFNVSVTIYSKIILQINTIQDYLTIKSKIQVSFYVRETWFYLVYITLYLYYLICIYFCTLTKIYEQISRGCDSKNYFYGKVMVRFIKTCLGQNFAKYDFVQLGTSSRHIRSPDSPLLKLGGFFLVKNKQKLTWKKKSFLWKLCSLKRFYTSHQKFCKI